MQDTARSARTHTCSGYTTATGPMAHTRRQLALVRQNGFSPLSSPSSWRSDTCARRVYVVHVSVGDSGFVPVRQLVHYGNIHTLTANDDLSDHGARRS